MSNGGIFLLLTIYVTAGAYFFQLLEYDALEKTNDEIVRFSHDNEIYFNNFVYKYMWPARFAHNFSSYVDFFFESFKDRVTMGLSTTLYYTGEELSAKSLRNSWTFTSALLFTTTTVTTIGEKLYCL
uniref:Potassium channel domain-containing protein n=1 Tax=Romanomermis culicivorax TaxID=13658 RepID=A0A915JND6_ROMCU